MPPSSACFVRPAQPACGHSSSSSAWHATPTPFHWPYTAPSRLLHLSLSCAGLAEWSCQGAEQLNFSVTLSSQTGSYISGSGSDLEPVCFPLLLCPRSAVPWSRGVPSGPLLSCPSVFYGNSFLPRRTRLLHCSLWDGLAWCHSPRFWSQWCARLVSHTCRIAHGRYSLQLKPYPVLC